MPYKLLARESVRNGVRRIANEQIERAMRELQDGDLSRGEVIHQLAAGSRSYRTASSA